MRNVCTAVENISVSLAAVISLELLTPLALWRVFRHGSAGSRPQWANVLSMLTIITTTFTARMLLIFLNYYYIFYVLLSRYLVSAISNRNGRLFSEMQIQSIFPTQTADWKCWENSQEFLIHKETNPSPMHTHTSNPLSIHPYKYQLIHLLVHLSFYSLTHPTGKRGKRKKKVRGTIDKEEERPSMCTFGLDLGIFWVTCCICIPRGLEKMSLCTL